MFEFWRSNKCLHVVVFLLCLATSPRIGVAQRDGLPDPSDTIHATDDSTAWFADIWTSSSKRHTRRGACSGEYEEDKTLDLENYGSVKGEFEVNLSFFSDKGSSEKCDESDDNVATLDITYKLTGTYSGNSDSVTVNAVLKKCEEDGSFHECDSAPRSMQLTVRQSGGDSVVVQGNVAGTSEHTLHRDKGR